MDLISNASNAIIFSCGAAIANFVLHFSQPESNDEHWFEAIYNGWLQTWPMYLFCAIVGTSLKFVLYLALANVSIPVIVWFAVTLFAKDVTEPKRHLEHILIIGSLFCALEVYLILNFSFFVDFSQSKVQIVLDERFVIQLLMILVKNAMKSIPLIFAICIAQTTTFFTNQFLHETFVCIKTMKMHLQNYHWYHAFIAGIFFEDAAIWCLIVCAIIPFSWTIVLYLSCVIVLIPWLLYFATPSFVFGTKFNFYVEFRIMLGIFWMANVS